ncbi:MAG: lysophospholipase [Candidatus Omnitrophica bacterium]|nr:lysophospholipase [Candidatus Omnitrophota bacterium]
MTADQSSDYFITHDRLRLAYRYLRKDHAQGTLLILHGHGEHYGRYLKFEKELENIPLSIALFDQRGQGRSEGREVYCDSFRDFTGDVTSFVQYLKAKYEIPDPIYLLGHSLGALVAVFWAMEHPENVRSMVLSSPCLGLRLPQWIQTLNDCLNQWLPKFCYHNPVYPPHLTHHPEEVKKYRQDPFIKRKITVRMLHEMLSYMAQLDAMTTISWPFPVHILMAGSEKIVDASKTKQFFEKLRVPDKEIFVFEGFYHEIFNEWEQEKAFEEIRRVLTSGIKNTR